MNYEPIAPLYIDTRPIPGEEIRAARKELGMTQTQCWQAIGVRSPTWSRWERESCTTPALCAMIREMLCDGATFDDDGGTIEHFNAVVNFLGGVIPASEYLRIRKESIYRWKVMPRRIGMERLMPWLCWQFGLEPAAEIIDNRDKLCWDQVREIRRLHEAGVRNTTLGEQFGVAATTISAVVCGVTWVEPF